LFLSRSVTTTNFTRLRDDILIVTASSRARLTILTAIAQFSIERTSARDGIVVVSQGKATFHIREHYRRSASNGIAGIMTPCTSSVGVATLNARQTAGGECRLSVTRR
jgi:hypothetical protein